MIFDRISDDTPPQMNGYPHFNACQHLFTVKVFDSSDIRKFKLHVLPRKSDVINDIKL